jgi:hypothetical protein
MKSRLTNGTRAAAFVLGLIVTTAVAFFIGNYVGEGSKSGKIGQGGNGKATLPLNINFPEGELTPTKAVDLTVKLNNTTNKTLTFKRLSFTITPEAAGCEAKWFFVKVVSLGSGSEVSSWESIVAGGEANLTYPPGERNVVTNANTGLQLAMKEEAGVDQSKCEGTGVTVSGKLS